MDLRNGRSSEGMRLNGLAPRYIPVFFLSLLASILVAGCDGVSNDQASGGDWLISRKEVVDGGPGKDGIPSIDAPHFDPASATSYVAGDRRVVGIKIGDEVRAYPHQILDWHEIINDEIGGIPIALTYCPLTGTASAWNRVIDGSPTEFGGSGLLFRNNLVLYDRNTDSNWSQMQLRSVNGSNSGRPIDTYQVVETTWNTWISMYPDSEVLNRSTGFSRAYQSFTYGPTYSTNPAEVLFPIRNDDGRLGRKERVHGIIPRGGASGEDRKKRPRVYPIRIFTGGVRLITDRLDNTDYVIVGSSEADFAVAFEVNSGSGPGSGSSFTAVQNALPVIMEDDDGNRWDIFGTAVSGPRSGDRLKAALSYTGYWFGWADFFPDLEIFNN